MDREVPHASAGIMQSARWSNLISKGVLNLILLREETWGGSAGGKATWRVPRKAVSYWRGVASTGGGLWEREIESCVTPPCRTACPGAIPAQSHSALPMPAPA